MCAWVCVCLCMCNPNTFWKNLSPVDLTFLTGSDWVAEAVIYHIISSSMSYTGNSFLIPVCMRAAGLQQQLKPQRFLWKHISAGVCMYVTEPSCPLFHPEKTEILPLHPAQTPSPPLSPSASTPALIRPCSRTGKMTERGKSEWREERKR